LELEHIPHALQNLNVKTERILDIHISALFSHSLFGPIASNEWSDETRRPRRCGQYVSALSWRLRRRNEELEESPSLTLLDPFLLSFRLEKIHIYFLTKK
jgi:hypothetical protein